MKRMRMKMNVIWYQIRKNLAVRHEQTYLHAILEFGYYGALGDEREELAAPGERQRDDESTED
jgi:hypothetical protein